MEKEFEEWYKENERRFHCGHFDQKQIAYSAWSEAYRQALSMSGVGCMFYCQRGDVTGSKRCDKQCEVCKPDY